MQERIYKVKLNFLSLTWAYIKKQTNNETYFNSSQTQAFGLDLSSTKNTIFN